MEFKSLFADAVCEHTPHGGPPYYRGADILLFSPEGRVLILEKTSRRGEKFWTLPGGTLKPGESFATCAFRECREKLNHPISGLHPYVVIPKTNKGTNKPVMIFLGTCDEEFEPELTDERFTHFQWVEIDRMPLNITDTIFSLRRMKGRELSYMEARIVQSLVAESGLYP